MIRRRLSRLREKDTRKLILIYATGKMLGVGAMFAAIKGITWFLPQVAGAEDMKTLHDVTAQVHTSISAINTAWVLVTAFLVFFMQAGFMGLEIGFARSKETVNVLMECVFDTCLCGILYWAFGFAFQFGAGNAFIGHNYFFLHGAPVVYNYGGVAGGVSYNTGVAFLAFFLFQFAFADTASTVTSGAMIGRTSFKGDILYSMCVSGFFYPIFGHWAWGPGGWLQNLHTSAFSFIHSDIFFRDFAGSTVVHTVGGVIALMGAIVLGPRLGRKFKRDGGGPTPPSDLAWGAIGGVILWFGWYGFNPGSTLSALDFAGIGRVAANTTLAACAGGMVAVFFVYPRSKKWDLGMSVNGFLGGLVAITAPCYWVSPGYAVLIGAIAGVIVPLAVDAMEYLRIDDPIGAVAVHMVAGIWGTLSIGLFASGDFGPFKGLFYGGGTQQLWAQAIGSASCLAFVGGLSYVVFRIIATLPGSWNLRLEQELELEGIDITEHGTPAYHVEFGQGMTYTTPSGLPPRTGVTTPAAPKVEV
ncbi:MAG TPA: ammonium transporter [Acidimicrobiales bacterium]|nr:ammonium transporter [Acidimicrobiales bacterium]